MRYNIYMIDKVQKNNTKSILRKIQRLFSNEKGWQSEKEMIVDMANFRQERMQKKSVVAMSNETV